MISSKYDMVTIVLGSNIVFILLMISFVGLGHFETLAQGTNATTNSTNATSGINASSSSGGRAGEVSVVMPLGSSEGSVQTGYDPGYNPYAITVSPGDKVIWDNQDTVVHTATSGNPLTVRPDGKFDTGLVGANQKSKPITMPTQPGEYRYFCTVHPFLSGSVVVPARTTRSSSVKSFSSFHATATTIFPITTLSKRSTPTNPLQSDSPITTIFLFNSSTKSYDAPRISTTNIHSTRKCRTKNTK